MRTTAIQTRVRFRSICQTPPAGRSGLPVPIHLTLTRVRIPCDSSPSGGAALTITGTGFGGSLSGLEVSAAGVVCTPLTVQDGTITCAMADRAALASSNIISVGDRGVEYARWTIDPESSDKALALSTLRGLAAFPDKPDASMLLPDFEAPSGWAATAGSRMRGWFTAPVAASYSFVVTADAEAELRWSTNESARASTLLASVAPGTDLAT